MNASLLKKTKHWDIVLVLLLGLLSLTWFRGDNLISGGDFGIPLDWVKYLRLMFYSWDETYSMGAPNPRQLASLIPYALTGGLIQIMGFSLVFIEKVLFYIWFAGSGLSMYYLCTASGMRRLGRLAASLFYMFNPFSLMIIWRVSHGLIQMPYAFAPLVLGLFINGLKSKEGLSYIVAANFVWLLVTASAYANPRMAIVHWLPIGFYLITYLFLKRDKRIFALKYSLSFLVFWILLNFYWILPFVTSIGESVSSAHSPFLMTDIEEVRLTSVNLVEAIRTLGYWSLKSGYKGDPYYSYWQFYESSLANLISWLIPILVVLGFFHNQVRNTPLKYFFLSLLFFGLLGIVGASPPVGGLILQFYRLLPPLALLARFNFLFFGMPTYLIFSVLLGFGFLVTYDYTFERIGKAALLPLGLILILLCVILVFPFWNGEVIKSEGKITPGERLQIPDYWWEAKEWLASQRDFFRILPLPMSKTYNVALDWGEGYSGGDPTRWLSSPPVLNVNTGETFKIPVLIGEAIEEETEFRDVANLLGFLNVRYLLVRNDTRWEFLKGHGWWFGHNPENIEKFVKNQEGLSLEKTIGELEFYRLEDKYLLPHIYAPSEVLSIDGEVGGLVDVSQFLKPEEKQAFVLRDGGEANFIWRGPSIPKVEGRNDLTRAVYEVHVKEGGRYEMLLRNDDFVQFYQPGEPLGVSWDTGDIQEIPLTSVEENLISLGEVELAAGIHVLTIFPPPAVNLVKETLPKGNIFSFPITDFKVGDRYSIAFSGPLLVWENYTDSPEPTFDQEGNPFGLADFKTEALEVNPPVVFRPHTYAKSFGVSVVSSGGVEALVDDLKVQRVFDNPLILKNLSKERERPSAPRVSFKKISPVKYEVDVVGATKPYLLVFSESFNSGWTSSVSGGHLMVNGFANGWFIDKPGDYKITLFFEPQKIYYIGISVSLLTVIISLVYVRFKRCGWRPSL